MLRSIAFLSVLPATALLGCATNDQACTLIGCASPLEVGFTGATDKAGFYQVDLVADGDSERARVRPGMPHGAARRNRDRALIGA
jgi:hypothetical protein